METKSIIFLIFVWIYFKMEKIYIFFKKKDSNKYSLENMKLLDIAFVVMSH